MNSISVIGQKAKQLTLSAPGQATLLTSLVMLILWTIYFSPYPPVHDTFHKLRHSTESVACH